MLKAILVILSVILSAGTFTNTGAPAPNNPFVGEWKLLPSQSRMPDEMKVRRASGDTYAFDFGGGVETIVVDGSVQPGVGGTLLSVRPEAPDTWIVKRKQGNRVLLEARWKLSSDQRTLTDHFREFEADGSTQSVDYVYQRTGRGSGFAADWRSIKETINSPYLLEVKAYRGDGLTIVDPVERRTKNLKLDGKQHPPDPRPNSGRPMSSSLRRVAERALRVTDTYDRMLTVTEDLALSPDLKILTMTVHITGRELPDVLVFERA